MEGLNPLDIVIHIINIVVLFLLLRLLIYKPVRKFMADREEKISKQLDDAQTARQDAETLQQQCTAQLTEAKEQAAQMVRSGEEQASQAADAILADARKEANAILENARRQAEEDRRRAVASMQEEITDLATEMAGRILRREVRLEDNRAVVEDFLKQAE